MENRTFVVNRWGFGLHFEPQLSHRSCRPRKELPIMCSSLCRRRGNLPSVREPAAGHRRLGSW